LAKALESGNQKMELTAYWKNITAVEPDKSIDFYQANFADVYEKYERFIYAMVFRLLGNADDAFDITQEVFIRAYRASAKNGMDMNVPAWLYRIAVNASLDVLRRRKRITWMPWDPSIHAGASKSSKYDEPEANYLRQQTRKAVQDVLNRLKPHHRIILVLREYQNLSYQQIAEVMGLSEGAAKSMLHRAREKFRELMLKDYPEWS
jgi:RNA polymerase sigma-70 factor (ECF subfamily)